MTVPHMPPGKLYLVSTPIGNLGDFSARGIETLKESDIILAEDTRNTGKLLSRYQVPTRMMSFHDHSEKSKTPIVIDMLLQGKSVALVSDAGTPLVSDPGYSLVNAAIENKIDIVPIPGASAVLAALSVSGFPTDKFGFEGYAPRTEGKLRKFIEEIAESSRTTVFFETPHRIMKSLKIMKEIMGERRIMVGRELTKLHEEKIRGTVDFVYDSLENRSVKGEIVIVVKPK